MENIAVPSAIWRMLEADIKDKPIPQGLDGFCHIGIGKMTQWVPRRWHYWIKARQVLLLEKRYRNLTEAKLRDAAADLHETFRLGRDRPRDLIRGFAVIREVASRQLGERHYPVQLMGGFALNAGTVAEMATGEGKTLTATLAATVAGWRGRGCHVITVNDYLAQRDAEWMGQIYRFCGLRVGYLTQEMEAPDRRQAYDADITYGTNKEITADFLRDVLVRGNQRTAEGVLIDNILGRKGGMADRLVQRGLAYGIVDEADSVLIDEAVTPLIISGPAPNNEQLDAYRRAATLAASLDRGVHYAVNRRDQQVEFTRSGQEQLGILCKDDVGLWQGPRRRQELVTKALIAKELYLLDKQYVIDEDKIVIVDDFTGRLMPDRSWRDGLHQAVEAKEGIEVTQPKDTYARVSFQRFFRLYQRLSGMTGTGWESVPEFWQLYSLPVVVIPRNKRCRRKQYADIVLPRDDAKWLAILREIERIHDAGRPILVGTRSVRTSEHLSRLLQERKLEHQVLNAVRHREEAQIVAEAGQPGRITVSTNMAGRGTDIKLGRGVAEKGGLHVIAAERNESGRVDRQLFGRCARQGDPGSARAIVALSDELIQRYGGHTGAALQKSCSPFKRNVRSPFTSVLFRNAQQKAQRLARQRRKLVMQTDHWLDEHLGFASGV